MKYNYFIDGHGADVPLDTASYIIKGRLDDGNVTLTNFNWDELVAAISEENYVAVRLADPDGLLRHELVFREYSAEDGSASFGYKSGVIDESMIIFSNGDIDYFRGYEKKAVSYDRDNVTIVEKEQARKNIGAAPQSHILHGTIDDDNNVTLTNFNWDELVAAITSEENIYVAARLNDPYGVGKIEFALTYYTSEEQYVSFQYANGIGYRAFDLYSDGSYDYYEGYIGNEQWTFTLEDSSTVRKRVCVV